METANGSGAVNATVSTLSSLLPRADEPLKRADSIALKIRLASLLPPVEGQRYWLALVDFMTGKINRAELSIVLKRVLSDNTEAGKHSRPMPAPSTTSVAVTETQSY